MALISFAEYAKKHSKHPDTIRQMALRGGFTTAHKIGRNWVIDENEPYPDDKRVKSGEYRNWRKPKDGGSNESG